MALVDIDGFDAYDPTDSNGRLIEISTILIESVTGRDGVGKAVKVGANRFVKKTLNGNPYYRIGFSFYMEKLPSARSDLFEIVNLSGAEAFTIGATTSGYIVAYNGNTVIATGNQSLSVGAWQTLEVGGLIDNSGNFTVRLNGVALTNLDNVSADTLYSGAADAAKLILRGTNNGYTIYDNYYYCDDVGAVNTGFLGEVRVDTRLPDADEGTNDLTAVGAGTGNYERVDDATTADADTTYLYGETVGNQERFTFPDLPTDADTIVGIGVHAVMRKDGAGARNVKQSVIGSSATETLGGSIALGDGYMEYAQIVDQDPGTSAAWTKANANAVIAGIEIVT